MSKVSLEDVKKLRELSGVGMQDAQIALSEAQGDIEKAIENLRKKGAIKARKRAGRQASQGVIEAYVHAGKVGVLVELNCETDFVAKTDDFKNFVHDLALQVAAASPQYLSREDVPQEVLEKEKNIFREQMAGEKKPAEVVEKIISGKIEKYYQDVCLLEQLSIKESKQTIKQQLTDLIAKLGENIVVKRFTRYQLGE